MLSYQLSEIINYQPNGKLELESWMFFWMIGFEVDVLFKYWLKNIYSLKIDFEKVFFLKIVLQMDEHWAMTLCSETWNKLQFSLDLPNKLSFMSGFHNCKNAILHENASEKDMHLDNNEANNVCQINYPACQPSTKT